MKKLFGLMSSALALVCFAFTGCGGAPSGEIDPATESECPQEGSHAGDPSGQKPEEGPALSPLAALDAVDLSSAFGDRSAEGWSFAFKAEGGLNGSYAFRLTSEISDEEKINLQCDAGVGLEDLFGIRSGEEDADAVLFGGGQASLHLGYRGPDESSEPLSKDFEVGFRHDGDLVWYAGEGESETAISLSALKAEIEEAAAMETFKRMEDALLVIPEELNKGASLRLAVEKLIDLGFTAEIDDSDGLAVSLKANAGFYTDLLNDMLETFLPAKWLSYLPRADFGYERTLFDIRLAFGADGIFKEYSMSGDVALTASLEVRDLFFSESVITAGGHFSVSAN